MQANREIRKAAQTKGVRHWRIAHHLGVSEQTLVRWLRTPLPAAKREQIMAAISELSDESGVS